MSLYDAIGASSNRPPKTSVRELITIRMGLEKRAFSIARRFYCGRDSQRHIVCYNLFFSRRRLRRLSRTRNFGWGEAKHGDVTEQ